MSSQLREQVGHLEAEVVQPLVIYTVGHSTRSLEEFFELLRLYGVERVVDVRAVPRSRDHTQFNKEKLSPFLRIRRIKYLHLKELGALRRHARVDSQNTGWRNASLRGFADHMQSAAFGSTLERLVLLAKGRSTAIMCAEETPWRCHRALIADALTVKGFRILHILSPSSAVAHELSSMAVVSGKRITYPATQTPGTS